MSAAPLAERPVTALRGVGPALAESLARLGLRTVQDVLFHLPLRYEDRTRVVPIGSLRNGDRAVIEGEIQLAEVVFRRRRTLLVRIADGTGFVTLRFFHFSARSRRSSCAASACAASARCASARAASRSCTPSTGACWANRAPPPDALTPIYPTTEGVQQGRLRALTDLALARAVAGRARGFRAARRARCLRPAVARERAALRAPAAAGRGRRRAARRPPSGAAPARLRGAARAPAEPAPAAPGGRQGPRAAAAAHGRTWRTRCRAAPAVRADRRAAARLGRDRARPGARAPDDAAGAGRRRLRQDRGRGARRGARGRARRAGRA